MKTFYLTKPNPGQDQNEVHPGVGAYSGIFYLLGGDHIDHVKVQVALAIGGLSVVFGCMPVEPGLMVYLVLPLGLAAVASTVHLAGRPVGTD